MLDRVGIDGFGRRHRGPVDLPTLRSRDLSHENDASGHLVLAQTAAAVGQQALGGQRAIAARDDGTNEGLICHDVEAYSVQYHPEAAPGPNDAAVMFDVFLESVRASHA